jgi:DNA repair exonuclease SbcCD ATPase subunit
MSTEKSDLGKLEKKVDKLVDEIAAIKKELKGLASLEGLVKEQSKQIAPVSKIDTVLKTLKNVDDITSSTFTFVGDKFASLSDTITKSNESENILKKIEDVIGSVEGLEPAIESVKETANTENLNARIEEIMTSITSLDSSIIELRTSESTDVLGKKIDDLQQYIAGLSSLEETVENLSSSFTETQEIVGIIVRQLDDIERKYKSSIEEINEAVAMMSKLAEDIKSAPVQVSAPVVETVAKTKKEPPIGQPLPDSITGLIDYLLEMVTPQTEAAIMADSLERVRDRLTTMIKGHTPVLFQFGKVARELKSYPPTATLNENDIARLSQEIRGWRGKLEEMTDTE